MSGSRRWATAAVAAIVFVLHLLSPNATPFDSRWAVHTALSLLTDGDVDLREYLPLLERDRFYGIECVDGPVRRLPIKSAAECPAGQLVHYYPLGVPVMIAPVTGAMQAGLQMARPWLVPIAQHRPTEAQRSFLKGDLVGSSMLVELLIACGVIALASAVMFLYFSGFCSVPVSLGLAMVFAFTTPAWSTGSRALWMHGFSMLLLAGVLWTLHLSRDRMWPMALCGAMLALAFYVRPTNVVPAVAVAFYLWFTRREALKWAAAGAVAVALLFASVHFGLYGSPIPTYAHVRRGNMPGLSLGPHVPEAVLGNLFSPGRGLLVYCPLFLFAVWGLWRALRVGEDRRLPWMLASILAGHFALICLYEDWFAGDCYGPRYWSDVTPIWVAALPYSFPLLRARGPKMAFAAAVLAGLFMHYQGATCWPCVEWNAKPRLLREDPGKIWSWRDPPFLANWTRGGKPR